jgi:acyl-CoA dehydrogenase
MEFALPEEIEMIKSTVRSFVDKELRPLERQIESDRRSDPETMKRLSARAVELGIYGYNLPARLGGGDLSMVAQVAIAEELGRTTVALSRTAGNLPAMLSFAHPHQQKWFIDPLIRGEKYVTSALTEPDGGSDLGAMKTRATRTNGGWVLNGSKCFVSNVDISDWVIVVAVTDSAAEMRGRYSLFIVETTNPGFHFLRNIEKMSWKGAEYCAFSVEDCFVPDSHVLGEVNRGFQAVMHSVNQMRVYLAGFYVGTATEALSLARDFARERKTFGKRLADHQAIQFMVADIDCELQAARLLAFAAADAIDRKLPDARIAASRAKVYSAEMAGRATDKALQIFGAAGLSCDYSIERLYRDSRAFRLGEGTSEMQRIQIARHILD